jgi:hypothetical protein
VGYEFRATAIDRAGNRSAGGSDTVIVPIDDRDRDRMRFRGPWRRLERPGAWGRFVMRARARRFVTGSRASRATLRLAFRGRGVALIGRRLRRGGKLRFSVDGRSRVLRLRGTPRHRRVLYTSGPLAPGRHVLRLTALGGGPVEVDAVAPVP